MKNYDLAVIGGDAAGMSAASQARRVRSDISIAVFEKGEDVSYAACGMPYFISGEIDNTSKLIAIDREEFEKKRNIRIFTNHEVTDVDFAGKRIFIKIGDAEDACSFKKLVIATGAIHVLPPIKGADAENVFPLRNLSHGIAIRDFIANHMPKSAVIIGGGFIGLEMAESLTKLGIAATIVEKMESVAMTLSPMVREIISAHLRDKLVAVRTGVTINSIEANGRGLLVKTDTGVLSVDFAILSVGIRPNTDFLPRGELALSEKGAIIVNERSMTNIADVFAAGDCATVKHLITKSDAYVPLGTTANKQGRVAGLQAAGITSETFRGIVGSQIVKVFDLEIGKTGFNDADAARHGINAESVFLEGRSRAGYYPGAAHVYINLTINKDTREVIGGELVGTDGAALRTNVVAAAVAERMKIEDLAYLDLGYAPPFSPVWDPVIAAAQLFVKR